MKKILSLALCVMLIFPAVLPVNSVSAAEEKQLYRDKNYIFEIINDCEISIHHYIGTAETVTVPGEMYGFPVTSIEKWAFLGKNIKEVYISEGITTIGEEAFYNCQSLETVTLPSTLKNTEKAILRFCQNLKNVTFSGTDTKPKLGEYLLYACNSLESVNIPSKVTKIPEGMFAYCQSLDNVVLPKGTQKIFDNAFYGSGLSNITLPEPIYYIGDMAFADCTTLDEVNNLRETCDVVSENAFEGSPAGSPYEETEKTTIYFENYMDWSDITIAYYAVNYSETHGWCEIDMTYVETNSNGKDIYRADIPLSKTIYFNGTYEHETYGASGISSAMTQAIVDNNVYSTVNGLEITSYPYSPDNSDDTLPESTEDETEGTEKTTIYFENYMDWWDITIAYYAVNYSETHGWCEIDMTYVETNSNGKDIYRADIPLSKTIYFNGTYEHETYGASGISSAMTQAIVDNNLYYLNSGLDVNSYPYSPDNPTINTKKANVQPVGVSSSGEFSGQITEDGFLIGASFDEVVRREKSIAAAVGAQAEDNLNTDKDRSSYVRQLGNANLDDTVNIRDASDIQKHIADLIKLTEGGYKNADVDCNGKVNVKDSTAIQKHIADIDTGYEIGNIILRV